MNLQIETMKAGNIDAVVALERECRLNSRGQMGYRQALQDEWFISFVAMLSVKSHAAPILIASFSGLMVIDELQIDNIAVATGYRQKGVGTAVLSTALDVARRKGMKSAVLEVRSANRAAIGFYERLGFFTIGRRKNYYSMPFDDALIMGLDLKNRPQNAA